MIRKLLIWDIDGTLVDCGSAGRLAMDKTFKELYGVDNGFEGICMAGRLDQVILKDALKTHGIDQADLEVFYAHYKHVLDDVLDKTDVKVYKGVIDVLEYTKNRHDLLNVISTGNSEVGAWLKLKHAGIDHHFEHGGFGCGFSKREDLVGHIIRDVENKHQISLKSNHVFVIGDTPHDITSGKHHDATTIAVLTGHYTREELQAYEPTYIIDNFSKIDDFIDMLEV